MYAVQWLGVPMGSPFWASVVAVDIDDQRVFELALVLDFLNDSTNLVVGVGHIACEHLCLPGEQLLLVGRERIPVFQDIAGPGRELRIRGNHSQLLLVGEDLVARRMALHTGGTHV